MKTSKPEGKNLSKTSRGWVNTSVFLRQVIFCQIVERTTREFLQSVFKLKTSDKANYHFLGHRSGVARDKISVNIKDRHLRTHNHQHALLSLSSQ